MALQSLGPLIQIVGDSVQLLVRVIHKSVAITVSRQEQSACHQSNRAARSGGAVQEGRAAVCRKPDGLPGNRWVCQSRPATDVGAIALALPGCPKSLCIRKIPSPAK
jgi:hypothetical protein